MPNNDAPTTPARATPLIYPPRSPHTPCPQTLLWVRKAVELHRQRAASLSPFGDTFTEVVLGGAPLPTLPEADEEGHDEDGDDADADADGEGGMMPDSPSGSARAGPGGAVAYAQGSPVTFASRQGADGLPVGVLYNGTAVKNALEVRAVLRCHDVRLRTFRLLTALPFCPVQIRELYGLPPAATECGAALLLDLYSAARRVAVLPPCRFAFTARDASRPAPLRTGLRGRLRR